MEMDGTPGVASTEIHGIVILGMILPARCRHILTGMVVNQNGVGVLSSACNSGIVEDGMTKTAVGLLVSFVNGPSCAPHVLSQHALGPWASTARRVSWGRQQMLAAFLAQMRQNVAGQVRLRHTLPLEVHLAATTVHGRLHQAPLDKWVPAVVTHARSARRESFLLPVV